MIGLASRFCKVVCGMVLPVSLLALCIDAAAEVGVQPPRGDNVGQPGFQSPVVKSRTRSDGRSIYLIRLEQAPVASYRGGLRGLASTSPEVMGELKLDVRSAEARAYRAFLEDRQEQILDAITQRVGHEPETVYRYYYGNNGMAVWLTADEAAQVRELPGVISVQRDTKRQLHTDAGPAWIGASDLWAGSGGLSPTQGEGIVMGVIDTGINPSNPSFADVGADGYDHTNPRGASNYVGVCNPGDPGYDVTFPCNDKLIGAWGYPTVNGGDPRDYNRHGSHTASTAAGNHVDAVLVAPTVNLAARISGVAPHANIIAYAGCCTASALAAAIDHAIADGVDVINYSIGSGLASDAWQEFDTVGFRNARTAGIFVATSAGNNGPNALTVGAPADAAWLTSVGNNTHDRIFESALVDLTGGGSSPADMTGQSVTAGYGPASIVHAKGYINGNGVADDGQCLTTFPSGTWSGEIVVCDRGQIARITKGNNVLAGGAGGFVLANVDAQGESINADAHFLPAVHIPDASGDELRNWLAFGTGHMATIRGAQVAFHADAGDIMASSSSRGPNRALSDIIKPDVSAPGSDILAAVGVGDPSPAEWGVLSGTSMASPHVAGAAALIKSLHPTWTPAEIQSALMTTANPVMRKEDGATAADPFDMGSGRLDLADIGSDAVGLVLDETEANYLAANPATGGDPKTLNLPSMGNSLCAGMCSWTRTVRSVAAETVDWVVSVEQPPGWKVAVEPSAFTIMPGATQVLIITASATAIPTPQWQYGRVKLGRDIGGQQHYQSLPLALALTPSPEPAGSYTVTTSATDSSCAMPLANSGAYTDLESFGLLPGDSFTGDGRFWWLWSTYNFYGVDFPAAFTDDGFVNFDAWFNYRNQPWVPQPIPDSTFPNSVAAFLWGDHEIFYDAIANHGVTLAEFTSGGVGYAAIVEYDDIQPVGGGTPLGDMEVMLRYAVSDQPGGYEIIMAYDDLNPAALSAESTIGLESAKGKEAVAFLNKADPGKALSNGLAICYDYQPPAGGICHTYWSLNNGSASMQETYNARKAIFAGGSYTVSATGMVAFKTKAGGAVHLYPGFSVADGGTLSVDTNAQICL